MNFVKHRSTTKYHQEQHYSVFFGTRFLKVKTSNWTWQGEVWLGGRLWLPSLRSLWLSFCGRWKQHVYIRIYPIPSMYGRYIYIYTYIRLIFIVNIGLIFNTGVVWAVLNASVLWDWWDMNYQSPIFSRLSKLMIIVSISRNDPNIAFGYYIPSSIHWWNIQGAHIIDS